MDAIKVENLTIIYKTMVPQSFKKDFFSIFRTKVDRFAAIRGVSFTVEKGGIVGLVGRNGSGKSTLLRAMAGIFSADYGCIDTFGNSVSLLSIGVGFQKNLTGRDNIFLAGLLMGFAEKEIVERYDEIVAFSELGAMIDRPVRTYSSGMYSKLAFSITAVMETDIMLIDEVLSVGDLSFKKKSFNKMRQLIDSKDRTALIVSHNTDTIRSLCDRVIWLHQGRIKMDGEAGRVLDQYKAFMNKV